MIKVLLFDFYGVFLPDAYSAWLTANGLAREGVFETLISEFDRGKLTEEEFIYRLSKAVGRRVSTSDIHSVHHELNSDLIRLVRDLKERYSIGLFSNASKQLRARLDSLEISSLFDTVIISSETGYAKPSNEAFQTAIDWLSVSANEILFIDDNPRNIEAAARNRIQAIHYTTTAALREALQAHQIL